MRKILALVFAFLFVIDVQAKLPKFDGDDPLPSNLFVELAKMINPAVVNISTTIKPKARPFRRDPRRDPFFDLFEEFMSPQMPLQRIPQHSLGTGFIIRKDGLILTNNHVVDKADIIHVQLSENNKEKFEAQVIGRDSRTDIALIKIDAKKSLPVAKLGTSKDLEVGEWVAAFGNPFGHGHTVTKGIVSAIGREINELNRFSFIQTDASINPGNSGGPLVNTKGEVIGVNAAIDARAQGIGFAIPIDDVKSILPILEKKGGIERGYLGVGLHDVDENEAKSLSLKTTEGTLVTQIVPKSPAEKAGLKPYDFIIKFGKKEIKGSRDLIRAVSDTVVGQVAPVTVLRNGKTKTLKVKIASHPDNKKSFTPQRKSYKGQKAPFDLGFKVVDMSNGLQEEYGIPDLPRKHPLIIEIEPGSPASQAGLSVGDVILDVNKKPVYKATEVLKRLKKGPINMLRILRQEQVFLVYLRK